VIESLSVAVRIGLVGAGFMAKAHTLAYRAAPLFWPDEIPALELVRVVDVDRARAERAAAHLGWREATTELAAVAQADDVDLVDVVTPNDAHEEPALAAAAHGKALLCEKPLAHDLASAQRIAAAVERAGVLAAMSFVYRQWPAVQLARRLVDAGAVGRPRRLGAHFLHDYAADAAAPMTWRLERERAGAGSVGDLGSHLVDLAHHLVGPIAAVHALTATYVRERPSETAAGERVPVHVDDAADVLLRFASGATGHLRTGWAASGHRTDWGFDLLGDEGALRFSWERPQLLERHRAADGRGGFEAIAVGPQHIGDEALWPVAGQGSGWGDAFVLTIARVLRRLNGVDVDVPSVTDGLRVNEVLAAILASADAGAWVPVTTAPRRR
jgi:predicted dehydrogenase